MKRGLGQIMEELMSSVTPDTKAKLKNNDKGEEMMSQDKHEILRYVYAKYNELDSIKKYTEDEVMLKIIAAKQDTLSDMEKVIRSKQASDWKEVSL